jgi:hypothetical protein
MQKVPPTLDHMLFEHDIVHGLLILLDKRKKRGEKCPRYMLKTACNLAGAYLMIVQENFPEKMADQWDEVDTKLTEIERLYEQDF